MSIGLSPSQISLEIYCSKIHIPVSYPCRYNKYYFSHYIVCYYLNPSNACEQFSIVPVFSTVYEAKHRIFISWIHYISIQCIIKFEILYLLTFWLTKWENLSNIIVFRGRTLSMSDNRISKTLVNIFTCKSIKTLEHTVMVYTQKVLLI